VGSTSREESATTGGPAAEEDCDGEQESGTNAVAVALWEDWTREGGVRTRRDDVDEGTRIGEEEDTGVGEAAEGGRADDE
jgi:hypothetical protein